MKFTTDSVIDFLGVPVECSFEPVGTDYRSMITEREARLCYEAALRELVSDSLQSGCRIEVFSVTRKQCMNEYRVKLSQSFIHGTEKVSNI
ncbi:MAG: hypothetical protein LBC20_14695, partial [Planctomycetaceae bacterium]|nr:hypothetical protein [Planctomycetaceae bacterium]